MTSVLAFEVDFVGITSTPLQMLVTVALLTALTGALIVAVTQLLTPWVDKKWPATQTLNPTEMLWAEAGGHVQRTFKGLDLALSKDLATHIAEKKVAAGSFVFEQGDPPAHFYILKKGKAQVVAAQAAPGEDAVARTIAPGDSFGDEEILHGTARVAGVQAVSDCVVLQLPAEDYVAGTTLSAADDLALVTAVEEERSAARGPAPAPPAPAPARSPAPGVSPPKAVPARARRRAVIVGPAGRPTHVVPEGGMQAWSAADMTGEALATLAAGTDLVVVERTGRAARVVATNGWEGWVDGGALVAKEET